MTECQVCRFLVVDGPDPVVNEATLRFEGWKFFDGVNEEGKPHSVRICPTCGDVPPKKRPPRVLPGQAELF